MRLSTILFTLCLVPVLVQTAMGQGFSVSPSRVFYKGNPGETVSQNITFSNTSATPISFTSKIQDWNRDSLGNKVYANSGTLPASNAKWLSLSSNSIVIPPGQSKEVTISMTIPAKGTATSILSNSMVFFTQVKEQSKQQQAGVHIGVNILLEVGVQIYHTPDGLNPGELEFMAFNDIGITTGKNGKVRRLALNIHNTGSINKDAFVRFELTSKETGEEIKIEPQTIAMLPDAMQWVYIDLPADLKGKFLAIAILDAGTAYELKVAEKEISYRP